jgi:uncharacterized protein YciI
MFKNFLLVLALFFFAGNTMAQTNDNLFFVFLDTHPDKMASGNDKAGYNPTAHLQYLNQLTEEGKLFATGTFEGGGEMLILHAENTDEAQSFLQSDPAIQSNSFKTEVLPMMLAQGDMCGAKKPYKMVSYQLVRFTNTAKNSEQELQVIHDTRIFLGEVAGKKGNIVAQGYFDEQGDGFVIFNVATAGEAQKIFKKHTAVKSRKMSYEIKTLRIAKGTFCE